MQDKVKGFKINGFCYEIYDWDKAGKPAEVYFNRVHGSVFRKG